VTRAFARDVDDGRLRARRSRLYHQPMIAVRRALASDAAALAELGARTFADTFAAQNRAEDIDAYLAKTYAEALQRREIDDAEIVTLLVDDVDDGGLVAFAQLRGSASEFGDVELARFYVDREHHGRGVAQMLMGAAVDAARELGGATVWLGVWEHNARAIRFYEKCGFRDTGSQPFILGTDVQTDRVMTFVIQPR
jgi:ribosomal protein S18 acetylase RimI-like enzyme